MYVNGDAVNVSGISKKNINHFKNSLESVINRKMNEYATKITSLAVQSFANGVKNRLLKRAEPKDADSRNLVENIANSITVESFSNPKTFSYYSTCKIPIDNQNLVLYLEYGTGINGFNNPHPETMIGRGKRKLHRITTSKSGLHWRYASNYANKYKSLNKKEMGFYFLKSKMSYVNRYDVNPTHYRSVKTTEPKVVERRTKPYGPDSLGRVYKHGRRYKKVTKGKTYSYNYTYDYWVWSKGIKPLRFVYDTKKAVNEVMKHKSIAHSKIFTGEELDKIEYR